MKNDRETLAWIVSSIVGLVFFFGVAAVFKRPPLILGGLIGAMLIGWACKWGFDSLYNALDSASAIEKAKQLEEKRNDFSKEHLVTGISVVDFRRVIRESRSKLDRIRDMSVGLIDSSLAQKVVAITITGNRIIDEVLNDPKDFSSARTWFNTHIDQVETIVKSYKDVEPMVLPQVKTTFSNTLDELVINFNNLLDHLKENDLTSLKIDMAVLNDQLKVEKR
jgi:5-bromo-4-chloroindolyl phosphate hydrolysis protein